MIQTPSKSPLQRAFLKSRIWLKDPQNLGAALYLASAITALASLAFVDRDEPHRVPTSQTIILK
ncbi:MAG TPA: hypothetical protein VIN59_09515 [Alphaproteobacteria bacterium]